MFKSAVISKCQCYRYQLERRSTKRSARLSTVAFIGLNPSTADASNDDPTIRRCTAFAMQWQYKTLIMVNLFAWRATEPSDLKVVENPVGKRNDHYIEEALNRASLVVACWGEHGKLYERADVISARYRRRLHGLKLNKSGEPAHPLYLPATLVPLKLSQLAKNRSNMQKCK